VWTPHPARIFQQALAMVKPGKYFWWGSLPFDTYLLLSSS
jgi:hypothetical protein